MSTNSRPVVTIQGGNRPTSPNFGQGFEGQAKPREASGKLRSYVVGFILSILLTLTAFLIVKDKLLTGWGLTLALIGFAVIQLMVQLLFFLHLDRESKPRWSLLVFGFMTLVLAIVVIGSLWIMNNLNYRVMMPSETDKYLIEQEAMPRQND